MGRSSSAIDLYLELIWAGTARCADGKCCLLLLFANERSRERPARTFSWCALGAADLSHHPPPPPPSPSVPHESDSIRQLSLVRCSWARLYNGCELSVRGCFCLLLGITLSLGLPGGYVVSGFHVLQEPHLSNSTLHLVEQFLILSDQNLFHNFGCLLRRKICGKIVLGYCHATISILQHGIFSCSL